MNESGGWNDITSSECSSSHRKEPIHGLRAAATGYTNRRSIGVSQRMLVAPGENKERRKKEEDAIIDEDGRKLSEDWAERQPKLAWSRVPQHSGSAIENIQFSKEDDEV